MPARKSTRFLTSLPYWGYVVVGILAAVSPSAAVEDRIRAFAYGWAALFMLGGLTGGVGAAARRWVTERAGSSLIIVANAVYMVSLFATYALHRNTTALVLAVIFAILIAELLARQRELTILARGSAHRAREPK